VSSLLAPDTARPTPGLPEQRSTRAAFFVAGFGTAAWAPLVPYAKSRLGVGEGTLGLLLLCLGAGSIATMPLAGALAARFGCRRVIWAASLVICIALPLLATAGTVPLLSAALLLFGAGVGTVDVVINIQAVIVERAAGRSMMSGFHGLFSVGGIAGAAGVSAALWAAGSPLLAALCVAGVIVAVLLVFGRSLLPYGSDRDGPAFALPRGAVLLIGGLCFISFLAEGAMLDWSALILTALHGMDPVRAGLGYTVFSVAMTAGRLSGDRVVHALGGRMVLAAGGSCAAGGVALAVLAPAWPSALAGFALVGLGASNIVPVLFSAVGRQHAMPANLAVGAVTTLGYAGILAGPAGIGFAAHAAGLPTAFLGVAALLLVVAACSGAVTRKDGQAASRERVDN
jgi:predicted MFS family arabinose efflux permease